MYLKYCIMELYLRDNPIKRWVRSLKELTLKTARVNKGLTQSQAAKRLNVSKGTLGNWERGKCFPSIERVKQIEELYEVAYDDLIFLKSNCT